MWAAEIRKSGGRCDPLQYDALRPGRRAIAGDSWDRLPLLFRNTQNLSAQPTARNALVRDHYEKLGFALVSADGGETVWRLPVVDHAAQDLPMTIALRRIEEAV